MIDIVPDRRDPTGMGWLEVDATETGGAAVGATVEVRHRAPTAHTPDWVASATIADIRDGHAYLEVFGAWTARRTR